LCTDCLLRIRLRPSLDDNFTEHALFVVTGDETCELEFAPPRKPPDEFTIAVGQNTFRVRIIVLHVRMLFHDFRMFAIFHGRPKHEFVILLAVVLQNETDLFPRRTSIRAGS
jgi:hypothetical protein